MLGDAALLPDPGDVDGIADALAQALGDDQLRQTLMARGAERTKRFSWHRQRDEFAALYHDLAAGRRP